MKKWLALSAILFLSAIVMLAISVMTGESEFGLFIIFPFIIGSGPIAVIGAILLLAAIFVAFISFASRIPQEGSLQNQSPQLQGEKTVEKKFGGVVMIGPIPIAFGSDKKVARIMMIIGIILFVIIALALILSIML